MSKYRSFKATERRIARLLGGQRTGHLGGADVEAGNVAAECKHRQRLPQWLKDAVKQAREHAGADRLGIVVLHEHGERTEQDIVCLSLGDWLKWWHLSGDAKNKNESAIPADGTQ